MDCLFVSANHADAHPSQDHVRPRETQVEHRVPERAGAATRRETSAENVISFQELVHFYKLKLLPETRQMTNGKHLVRQHIQVR